MWKPFIVALAVGFGIVWFYRQYQKNKVLKSITYTDKAGNPEFAGPSVDPLTGDYIGPTSQPGTVGASQISN